MVTPTNLPVIVSSPTVTLLIMPDLAKNSPISVLPILDQLIFTYVNSASLADNLLAYKSSINPFTAAKLVVVKFLNSPTSPCNVPILASVAFNASILA